MFKYLIHRKGSSKLLGLETSEGLSIVSEDLLTSDVFGTIASYLPPHHLLFPFLDAIAQQNPHSRAFARAVTAFSSGAVDVEFWPHLEMPFTGKKWSRGVIEPDVFLHSHAGPHLLIEAKFTSSIDTEQLVREYIAAEYRYASNIFVLLLNKDLTVPMIGSLRIQDYVARRLWPLLSTRKRLNTEADVSEYILWSHWQSIHRVVDAFLNNVAEHDALPNLPAPVLNMVKDLALVLELRALKPFSPLQLDVLANLCPDVSPCATIFNASVAPALRLDLSCLASRIIDPHAVAQLFMRTANAKPGAAK